MKIRNNTLKDIELYTIVIGAVLTVSYWATFLIEWGGGK